MASALFYKTVIGRIPMKGTLSMTRGPFIAAFDGVRDKGVPLGSCGDLVRLPADADGPAGIWIAKYGREKQAHLPGFDAEALDQLYREFGLSLREERRPLLPVPAFFASEAALALVAWVGAHPRIAARYADTTQYLGDWYGWACREAKAARHRRETLLAGQG